MLTLVDLHGKQFPFDLFSLVLPNPDDFLGVGDDIDVALQDGL